MSMNLQSDFWVARVFQCRSRDQLLGIWGLVRMHLEATEAVDISLVIVDSVEDLDDSLRNTLTQY
jgi:hypothetical protein